MPEPSRRPSKPGAARGLAAALLAAFVLAGCGPDPAQIDRSPAAGMTAENPSSGQYTGENIVTAAANEARLTLAGTPAVDGAATVACAMHDEPAPDGHGEPLHTVRLGLGTQDGSPLRVELVVPGYHGDGEYEALVRVARQGADGAYRESAGSGTAQLHKGTLLNTDAATHWISGTFRAAYAGEAGSGEASGRVERCYYFK
jgi:hypothetical protein